MKCGYTKRNPRPSSKKRNSTAKNRPEELEKLSDHFKAIKAGDAKAIQQADDTMDSEHWIAICFQNRDQKEEFLRKLKLPKTIGDKYLDGMRVAKVLGVTLETVVPKIRKHRGVMSTLGGIAIQYTQDDK